MAEIHCDECGRGLDRPYLTVQVAKVGALSAPTYWCDECAPAVGVDSFDVIWARFAHRHELRGATDADYDRLRGEWEAAGRPRPVADFVRARLVR